jgi:hypothetical protein
MWDVVWTFVGVLGWAYVFAVGERVARRVAGPPELSATIEKGDVETRLAALERNFDSTREFFIDVLSITMTAGGPLSQAGRRDRQRPRHRRHLYRRQHRDPVCATDLRSAGPAARTAAAAEISAPQSGYQLTAACSSSHQE